MHPDYWYAVEYDARGAAGRVVEIKFWGRSIAVFRGADGDVARAREPLRAPPGQALARPGHRLQADLRLSRLEPMTRTDVWSTSRTNSSAGSSAG